MLHAIANPRDRGLAIGKPHLFFSLGVWWCRGMVVEEHGGLIERSAAAFAPEAAYKEFNWLYGKNLFRWPRET